MELEFDRSHKVRSVILIRSKWTGFVTLLTRSGSVQISVYYVYINVLP